MEGGRDRREGEREGDRRERWVEPCEQTDVDKNICKQQNKYKNEHNTSAKKRTEQNTSTKLKDT